LDVWLREWNAPDYTVVHKLDASAPEEDTIDMMQNMRDVTAGFGTGMSSYTWEYFDKPDAASLLLQELRRLLQTLSAADKTPFRWVLKSPNHMADLPHTLETFPRARVVMTHRDLRQTMPSWCSLMRADSAFYFSRQDLGEIGRLVLRWTSTGLPRVLKTLREMGPEQERRQFCHIRYVDLVHDPVATVERIYAHFELEVTPEFRDAMREYMHANPQGKHGRHRYDNGTEYGLTEAQIESQASTLREQTPFYGPEPPGRPPEKTHVSTTRDVSQ
jgi:hypothetical protein